MKNDLRSRLVSALRDRQVVVVVGAGVSIAATQRNPIASWPGLIEHGVEHALGLGRLTAAQAKRLREEIQEGREGDPDALPSAAGTLIRKLGGQADGRFARWLRESVGALRAQERDVLDGLDALRRAGALLATTSYDDLLRDNNMALPAVPWTAKGRVQRLLRREEDGILHLHGHWEEPESVILDFSSYDKIVSDGHAQAMEQAIASLQSFLFVGCGGTLDDPNFRPLRAWLQRWFKGSQHDHFRLVTEMEAKEVGGDHGGDRISPLVYGKDHAELGPYLKALANEAGTGNGKGFIMAPASVGSLPAWRDRFGRDDLFEDLVQTLLSDEPKPTPLLGGPGVGKSHLTICALHDPRVAAKYGSRRYFVRCDGATTAEAALGEVAKALGVPLPGDLLLGVRHFLANGPVVLALDNFETPWERENVAAETLLERLLVTPTVAVVASVRGHEAPLRPAWREAIEIVPLPPTPARDLFVRAAGGKHANDPHLGDFVEALDGLPVALELLGHSAQAEPDLLSLWSRWQKKKTALLKRGRGGEKETDAEISFELSIQGWRMSVEARRLLALLGRLPNGIAHQDLDALLPGEGEESASRLREVGLAFDEAGRLRVLVPIREYVARRHSPSDEDWERCLGHYFALAMSLGPVVGLAGGAGAMTRLGSEIGNLETLIREGLARKEALAAVKAAIGLSRFQRGSGHGSYALLELGAQKAQHQRDFPLQARALHSLGDIHLDRSAHAAARAAYEQAILLFQQTGDSLGQANCISRLGDIHLRRSEHAAARAAYEQALTLYQRIGDLLGQANCIRSLGDIHLRRSEHSAARAAYEQALTLYQQVGHLLGEANCIKSLGDIHLRRSDHAAARAAYEQALPLFQQIGALLGEAHCIRGLGDIHLRRSDHIAARAAYEQALTLYQQIGNQLGQANCIKGLGDIHLLRSDHTAARAAYEQALPLHQQIGNLLGEANCIKGLGDIHLLSSDHAAARIAFEQAFSLHQQIGHLLGQANCIMGRGEVALAEGDKFVASKHFLEALELYGRLEDALSIGRAHYYLAHAAEDAGNRLSHVKTAREILTQADLLNRVEILDREFGALTEPSHKIPKKRRPRKR